MTTDDKTDSLIFCPDCDGAGTPRVLLRKENMGIVATYKEVYGE